MHKNNTEQNGWMGGIKNKQNDTMPLHLIIMTVI